MVTTRRGRSRGFTLIELMIVISLILILVSISIPAYNQSILRAKESVLLQNLFTLRSLISQYRQLRNRWKIWFRGAISSRYQSIPSRARTILGRWTRKTIHCQSINKRPELRTCTADRARYPPPARPTAVGEQKFSSFEHFWLKHYHLLYAG